MNEKPTYLPFNYITRFTLLVVDATEGRCDLEIEAVANGQQVTILFEYVTEVKCDAIGGLHGHSILCSSHLFIHDITDRQLENIRYSIFNEEDEIKFYCRDFKEVAGDTEIRDTP